METGHTAWGTANHDRQQEMVDMAETCYESKDCQCQGCPGQALDRLGAQGAPEDTPLFPEWRVPLRVTSALLSVTFIYTFLREVLQPYLALSKNYFYKVPVLVMNKTLPWTSPCWLWSTCQAYWLPCSNSPEAPSSAASQRGWRAGCVYRVLNWAYQQVQKNQEDSWVSEDVWRMEIYISLGILSLGLLAVLAVSSLPSVSDRLSWREFTCIQRSVGYMALLLGTAHALVLGWSGWVDPRRYVWYTPPLLHPGLPAPAGRAAGQGRAASSLPQQPAGADPQRVGAAGPPHAAQRPQRRRDDGAKALKRHLGN
ncbi:hypothetical protein NHX12_000001 [Muraenolepis orangiensis]|uniref:Ferric oxidoreductase domain-containing protein n=1 Tax=Muraenolepis orangiensis TaxID=630683 RepID=A0A9Q0D6Z8_9TELE|nr:hypothetical protein NHX12_000001 [Muraenolepis orangiensis]